MTQHAEKEIIDLTRLCDKKGNLNPEAIGYAKKPIIDCNLTGHLFKKKKWNQWSIFGEEILFCVTICHFDYAAVCSIYFLEYETQRFFEKSITIPLGIGSKLKMPSRVFEPLRFSNNEVSINITFYQNQTLLNVSSSNFDTESLNVELTIHHPANDETLNVVVPWNRHTFQFAAKHHTLPTSGMVKVGKRTFNFNTEECYSVLNFGRGIWPREVLWNWGMASQKIRDQRIGINFGGNWTDGTGMTENAVFINGKMEKIHEDVIFSYDRTNLKKPWYITTKFTDHVMLTFHPFYERVSESNSKLFKSEVHQMVGYYDGQIKLSNGETLIIQQMLGCIEEHIAKW